MTADLLNKIYFDYRKELLNNGLKESKARDMFDCIKNSQRAVTLIKTTTHLDSSKTEEITHKNKGISDWLKQNPSMKKACKINGINKSPELRELIYNYWVVV